MNAKRTLVLLPLLLLAVVALFGVACVATVRGPGGDLWVDVEPPALHEEVVVERPGADFVWIGGYWDWRPGIHNYEWVGGRWERPPHRGARWESPRWEHGRRGWHHRGGYWR